MTDTVFRFVPNIYDGNRTMFEINKSQNSEIDTFSDSSETVFLNTFAKTANIEGIAQYEEILGIVPNESEENIEFRRDRVIQRLSNILPYTFLHLTSMLYEICFPYIPFIKIDVQNFLLIIRVPLQSDNSFESVDILLKKIVPANIIVDLNLLYNTYEMLESFTYEYLEQYTYKQLRSDTEL